MLEVALARVTARQFRLASIQSVQLCAPRVLRNSPSVPHIPYIPHYTPIFYSSSRLSLRLTCRADIDNRELERVKREAKRDEEWEVRARQVEAEEQTIHHLKVEEEKRQKEKRLKADKYIDNAERQRVVREAKRDEEWEVRARQIEAEEATLHHLKVEQAKRDKEKRLMQDKMLDNEELMRVKRVAKEAYEEEERARARESEQNTIKDMEKKEYDAEVKKRLLADQCE